MTVQQTEPLVEEASSASKIFKDYLKSLKPPPSTADIYAKEERAAGIQQKQQLVNDYTAQLNAITAKAQADKLSVTGQGRGIPEVIIGGQQAQIDKEAAIQALPVAAQLAAAQGNLQLAQQHLETRFNLLVKDAQNQYEYKNKLLGAVYDFATTQEKRRLDALEKENERTYSDKKDFLKIQNQLLLSAVTQGAPPAVRQAITSATNAQEAIAAAGAYGTERKNQIIGSADTGYYNVITDAGGNVISKTLVSGGSGSTPANVGSDLADASVAISRGADATKTRQAFLKDHPGKDKEWDAFFTNAQGEANKYPQPESATTKPWWQFW
jgi:hypothetical protein